MDLRRFLQVLVDRGVFVIVVVALCVAVAAALAWTRTPTYEAHTQLFVSTSGVSKDPSATYQGGLFSQERVLSYAQIVTSPPVLRGVIRQLNLPTTPRDLETRVSASVPTNTVLLDITVEDSSAVRAAATARVLATRFTAFVDGLERAHPSGASPVKIEVTSPAQVPTSPSAPRKSLYLVMGLVIGLVLGIGGAFLLEALAARLRDDDDLEAAAGAPVLGVVAEGRSSGAPVLAAHRASRRAQAYLWITASLQTMLREQGLRSIVLTSPGSASAGTIVANLGIGLAHAGYRVLCIDANFRRPRLAAALGVEPGTGLGDILGDDVPVEAALQSWSGDGTLDVIDRGQPPPFPAELIGSPRFERLLRDLESRYDVVLISSPPLSEAADGALAARVASGAIVVVPARSARADEVVGAVHALRAAGGHLLGVIVNRGRSGGRVGKISHRDVRRATDVPSPPARLVVPTERATDG